VLCKDNEMRRGRGCVTHGKRKWERKGVKNGIGLSLGEFVYLKG